MGPNSKKPNAAKLKERRDINGLIKALEHEDWDVREEVVEALGEIGDKKAVEPLIEALQDTDENVQWQTAAALGKIGDKRAVEALIKALGSPHRNVRKEAASALGKIRDIRAVDSLVQALVDSCRNVQKESATALGKIRDQRAVEPLMKAMKDETWDVRARAAKSLGEIGDQKAIEPLLEALKDEDVRWQSASALGKLGWKPKNNREKAWYLVAKEEWLEVAELGEAAVEPLIEVLKDEDPFFRADAIDALGELGEPAVEPLIEALKDEDENVRGHASSALGEIGDTRAVEPLIEVLRKDEVENVRAQAATALGEIGDHRAVEPLTEALKDMARTVRRQAAAALGEIGDRQAVEPLTETLKDMARNVRRKAAFALGEIGDRRAVKPLAETLKDKARNVRKEAASALAKIGDPRAIEPLIEALRDKDIRRKAAAALNKLGWEPRNAGEKAWFLMAADERSETAAQGQGAEELGAETAHSQEALAEATAGRGALRGRRFMEPINEALADGIEIEQPEFAPLHVIIHANSGVTENQSWPLPPMKEYPEAAAPEESPLQQPTEVRAADAALSKELSDQMEGSELEESSGKAVLPLNTDQFQPEAAQADAPAEDLYEFSDEFPEELTAENETFTAAAQAIQNHAPEEITRREEPGGSTAERSDKPWKFAPAEDGAAGYEEKPGARLEPFTAAETADSGSARGNGLGAAADQDWRRSGELIQPRPVPPGDSPLDTPAAKPALPTLEERIAASIKEVNAVKPAESDVLSEMESLLKAVRQKNEAILSNAAGLETQKENRPETLPGKPWRPIADGLSETDQTPEAPPADTVKDRPAAEGSAFTIQAASPEEINMPEEQDDLEPVESLIETLKDKDVFVRKGAAVALGERGDTRAVQALITALKDEDPYVRNEAASALGKIGDTRALEPLIEALEIGRMVAAKALGQLGDVRAVEPLIKALKDIDGYVRKGAAVALGEIGDQRAVNPLINALRDKDLFVRRGAAAALGKLGNQKAVDPLTEALNDTDKYVQAAAKEALELIQKASSGYLQQE